MNYTFVDGQVKPTTVAINSVPLPPPSSMSVLMADLHGDAERTAAGILVVDLIRSNVYKLELDWAYLTIGDMNNLKAALGIEMWKTISFLDDNIWRNMTGYKSDFTYNVHRIIAENKIDGYTDISVSLVQR